MVNFVPRLARFSELGHPGKFQRVSRLSFVCTDVAQRRSTKLHDVWPSPGLVHYIYFFRGLLPLTEFCQVQNSLCVQVLHFPILAALLHGTRAVGVSQTLRRVMGTGRPSRSTLGGRTVYKLYKSSAVAEVGDRGHNRHGPKWGGVLCPFRGALGTV